MESYEMKQRLTSILIHAILIIFSIIMIVPFAWMVLTALKTNQEAISVNPFYIFPQSGWHWENFGTVWKNYNFVILYKNTLLMIFFRVLCACLTATMAGYAFGRLNFPGKKIMFSLVLVQMMVPVQIFIGNDEYYVRPCISGSCYGVWHLFVKDRLRRASKGSGRGGITGRL